MLSGHTPGHEISLIFNLLQTFKRKIANKLKNWSFALLFVPLLVAGAFEIMGIDPSYLFMMIFLSSSIIWTWICISFFSLYEDKIKTGLHDEYKDKDKYIIKMSNIKNRYPSTEVIIKKYFKELNKNKDIPSLWWLQFYLILENAENVSEKHVINNIKKEFYKDMDKIDENNVVISSKIKQKIDLI